VKYQWLLFDADGTLFDFDRAAAATLADTFVELGHDFEAHYHQVYEKINRQIWQDFEAGRITQDQLRTQRFELLFAALGVVADPEAFSAKYLKNLSAHTDLLEDAEDVVRQLSTQAKLMIITNGLQEVQRPRFAAASISRYFTDFVISEEVGAAKPDPRIFTEAFIRMGDPPKSEVLIIGDSLTSDIKGGINYGIDTCWYNPKGDSRSVDWDIRYEIAGLKELLAI